MKNTAGATKGTEMTVRQQYEALVEMYTKKASDPFVGSRDRAYSEQKLSHYRALLAQASK